MGTLSKYPFTFMTASRLVLLRMRNISDRSCRGNKNTYFMFNFFPPENRAVYQILSKNTVELETTDDNKKRRMRFAQWIHKATRARALARATTHTARTLSTMVTRVSLSVTLYAHCQSCFLSLPSGFKYFSLYLRLRPLRTHRRNITVYRCKMRQDSNVQILA
jgi:hypothetical protein